MRQAGPVDRAYEFHDRLPDRVVTAQQVAAGGIAFHHPAVRIQHGHTDGNRLKLVPEPGEFGGQRILIAHRADAVAAPDDLARRSGRRTQRQLKRIAAGPRQRNLGLPGRSVERVVAEPFEGARGIVLRAEDIHRPETGLFFRLGTADAQEFQERSIDVGQPPVALFERHAGSRYDADPVEHVPRGPAASPQGAPHQDKGDKAERGNRRIDRNPRIGREPARLLEIIEYAHRHTDEENQQK